ncbi:helix-turn-helix transcriptional regulator [Actinoallomurus sp. NPDC052308]|uniref:helix-turn-helix transcriptional regulator n=1 Tax=Actinoallomurus sp. NPDC052308 TaxID=3155530 RepID=UPI0034129AEE
MTESLARRLGYRTTTFFVAPTFAGLTADQAPVTTGRATRMVPSYVEEFHRNDPLVDVNFWVRQSRPRPMSLDELTGAMGPSHRRYLETFLFRNRIHAKVVIPLVPGGMTAAGGCAGIGLLAEEPGAFGPRDLAIARELHRHLTNLFRHHTAEVTGPLIMPTLSPRQRDVAELVAQGKSNKEIAQVLYVGVDTVKKHLTQVLRLTGCSNRTELAIKYGAGPRVSG